MKKKPYLPPEEDKRVTWLNNFSSHLGPYAASLGISNGELLISIFILKTQLRHWPTSIPSLPAALACHQKSTASGVGCLADSYNLYQKLIGKLTRLIKFALINPNGWPTTPC